MVMQAAHEFELGLEGSSTHSKTLHRYQKDWVKMGDLVTHKEFEKKRIRVIGDKKAGGNSSIFRSNPNEFCKLIDFLGRDSVYFIQIVRDPIESIFSYTKSHKYSIEEAATRVIQDTQTGIDISRVFTNYIMCRYDLLLKNPENTLESIFSFLGEKCEKEWLQEISKKISKKIPYEDDDLFPIIQNCKIMKDIESIDCFKEILNDKS
jgi:hypothetical protein